MPNPYYDHTTFPAPNSLGSSAAMRTELNLIEQGFDKLPTLTGNGYKVAMVNATGTAMIASSALQSLAITGSTVDSTPVGGTTPAAGAFTTLSASSGITGNLTGNVTGNVSGNAGTVTNGVYTTGSYANPSWLTSLAGSKITGDISGNAAGLTATLAIASGGTGQTTAGAAINALLPSQSGNSGRYLTTDGSNPSWTALALRAQSSTPFLTTLGSAAGNGTGTGTYNVAVGVNALDAFTTGASNVAVGFDAGGGLTTGSQNVAVGHEALVSTQTHTGNVAIGYRALMVNTANSNVAIGSSTGVANTTGNNNVFVGFNAAAANTTGSYNVALGRGALGSVQTTDNHIAIGFSALSGVTSGAGNIGIGYQAAATGTGNLTTGSNNIVIGNNATTSSASVSNEITLGSSTHTTLRVPGLGISSTTTTTTLPGLTTSGVVTISAGTAAAPALTTIGDTDTGVFFPAANTWAVATGASERMRIDSSGNVGIGTAAPTNAGAGAKFVTTAASTVAAYQAFGGSSTDARVFADNAYGGTGMFSNHPFLLYTNSSERMRISSGGDVGIGTTSPAYRLDVANGFSRIGAFNTQSFPASENSLGGAVFGWNRSNGSAEVNITNVFDNAALSFEFAQKTGASTANVLYSFGNSNHLWYTGGFERMRISSAGNVGIGTTDPQATLHVAGTILSASSFGNLATLQAVGGTGFRWTLNNDGTYRLQRTTDGFASVAATPMLFDASGNVGIGMTPGTKLDVQGDITARGASISSAAYINMGTAYTAAYLEWVPGSSQLTIMNSQAGPLRFATNNGERMRITSAGNVGINDSNPGYLLTLTGASNPQVWVSATNVAGNSAGISFENQGQRNWQIWADRSTDTLSFGNNSRGTTNLVISNTGNVGIGTTTPAVKLEVAGQIRTEAPTGGTAANWRLGTVHTVSPTSPNRTIEVDIGGTIYYLHAKTTNN